MSKHDIDIYELVRVLVGPINPVGETNIDNRRLENLKQLTDLVDKLMVDINYVAANKDSKLHSIKVAGQHVMQFLESHSIPVE